MRFIFVIIVLIGGGQLFAQDSLNLEEDTLYHSFLEDSVPQLTVFQLGADTPINSRIAEIREPDTDARKYFLVILMYSIILTTVYLNSKELVRTSVLSIFNLSFAIQLSRTEKQSNTFYFILYLMLFIAGLSVLMYFVSKEYLMRDISLLAIIGLVSFYFVWDYYFSNFFLLFTKKKKSIDLVQTISISYSVIFSFILWPLLFLVVLSALGISKLFLIVTCVIFSVFIVIKELREIQVLWLEKVDILSIHFFAYLCTFKFLPLLIAVKLVF